jgi:hypothetical protein
MTVPLAGADLHRFSEVSRLTERIDGGFEGEVSAEWTIGGKPNGGYLLAMMGRAATTVGMHAHPIAASAHYVRSPEPGPVTIKADVLRTGRSASQISARMSQDGRRCVEALFTTADLDPDSTPFWDGGAPAAGTVAYDACPRLIPEAPGGIRVAIMEQVEVRLEPGSSGFAEDAPSGRGELRGWLALPGGEPFDALSLLFGVDALPPATFDVAFAGWVPTLELTVYVRALPSAGPVRVLQRAQLIESRRVDEACFVWDGRGRLVAQATQLAGIRLG